MCVGAAKGYEGGLSFPNTFKTKFKYWFFMFSLKKSRIQASANSN